MNEADDGIMRGDVEFPKLETISAGEGFHVLVKWRDERAPTVVDLAPTIFKYKLYAPLRSGPELFRSIHKVDATMVAWGDEDQIDMHVSEIRRLQSEAMQASDFKNFLAEQRLSRDAAAAQLGISRRMVGYYLEGHEIPRSIALACAYIRGGAANASAQAGSRGAYEKDRDVQQRGGETSGSSRHDPGERILTASAVPSR